MQIKIAASAGFCPGVKRAVETALDLCRSTKEPLYMLGEIVHNTEVVSDLLARGFILVNTASECPDNAVVLIRAHGVPPQTLRELEEKQCRIFDRSCPVVSRVQKLVAQASQSGRQILISGKKVHPEVIGLCGFSSSPVEVFESAEDAENFTPKIDIQYTLLSQTTFSATEFFKISQILGNKIANIEIFDTICSTTISRQGEVGDLAAFADILLVIGSKGSSNTRELAELCRQSGRETHLIQRPDQVMDLFKERDLRQLRIGVTAGASTPERMIREVIQVMTEHENLGAVQAMNQEQEPRQDMATEEKTTADAFLFPEAPMSEQVSAVQTTVSDVEVAQPKESQAEAGDEQMDIDFSDYIGGIPQLKRGSVVNGTVVRYDSEFVYIDVRDKSEGKVPLHEFYGDPDFNLEEAAANHQRVDVYVRNIKNSDHGKEIMLSKAKVDFTKHKEAIEKAFEEKIPVTVKVTNVVKDGVIAAYGSVDLYIHRTQLELSLVDDLESYRGKTIDVLITQYDPNRKRLRVSGSRRQLISRDRKQKSRDLWDGIVVNAEFDGVVRNLTSFGAFVDIGGVDGLVHISELSWKRIKHPSEVIAVGDHIHVFVKEYDREKKRISLGFRRPENDPYFNIEQRFPVGSIVRGIVVRMYPFGAFIEIAAGVDALCHISQISNYRLNRPNDVLQEGMEVDARVLEVSDSERKISISIKEVEPIDPEHPELLQQQQASAEQGDENRKPRRTERRPRNNSSEDSLPTTYTDATSGSSLAALADFTASSKEGAEAVKTMGSNEFDGSEEA